MSRKEVRGRGSRGGKGEGDGDRVVLSWFLLGVYGQSFT